MATVYKHLFQPARIGRLELKNRIVMPAMATRYAAYGGRVTRRLVEYYLRRARGGAGLIVVEHAAVTFTGRSSNYSLGIYHDRLIVGLKELTRAVKGAGAKVAVQLAHAGAGASSSVTGVQPVAPSSVPRFHGQTPLEISIEQIGQLIQAFAAATRRAVEAGFDAVELHMAHGYLIDQFLSPLTNKRNDHYGGNLSGRARFALETLERTIEAAGRDFPVICRITGDQFVPGGLHLEDSRALARMLEQGGAAALHVTGGTIENVYLSAPPMAVPGGGLLPLAEDIKRSVNVPVIAVGKIRNPESAEQILTEGRADLVALGRALIADPELPKKALEHRGLQIRPCISCNNPQCHGRIHLDLGAGCTVNPLAGRELETGLEPAHEPKKVLIVGAGPAGLEAARDCALRGHQVVLCEKAPQPGGQILLAALPPHKAEMGKLLDYYRSQLEELKVETLFNCSVTRNLLEEKDPDLVLVATGAKANSPPIPGAVHHAVHALEVLAGRVKVGRSVVIVGGGEIGCETAEYLAQKGAEVTVLEMTNLFASNYIWWAQKLLLDRLAELQVNLLPEAKVMEIKEDRVIFQRGGLLETVAPVDTVVLAAGMQPQTDLVPLLEDMGLDYRMIGDCKEPRNAAWAIREGFEAARAI